MFTMTGRIAAMALLLATPLAPAFAQSGGGLTLAQVERKYTNMSPVHIEKCDRNGDEIYTNAEMQCVAGIYRAMYLDND
jgi:hypothetical protein